MCGNLKGPPSIARLAYQIKDYTVLLTQDLKLATFALVENFNGAMLAFYFGDFNANLNYRLQMIPRVGFGTAHYYLSVLEVSGQFIKKCTSRKINTDLMSACFFNLNHFIHQLLTYVLF